MKRGLCDVARPRVSRDSCLRSRPPARRADHHLADDLLPHSIGDSAFTYLLTHSLHEVLAFDVVDDGPARAMGHVLEWDQDPSQPWDLKTDLFAWYTLVRKK